MSCTPNKGHHYRLRRNKIVLISSVLPAGFVDRAAMVLQRMYRVRAARKKRTLVRWKWDMEMAKLKSKGTSDAAVIIQCWWRVMRAKWLALQLLLVTIEVGEG